MLTVTCWLSAEFLSPEHESIVFCTPVCCSLVSLASNQKKVSPRCEKQPHITIINKVPSIFSIVLHVTHVTAVSHITVCYVENIPFAVKGKKSTKQPLYKVSITE